MVLMGVYSEGGIFTMTRLGVDEVVGDWTKLRFNSSSTFLLDSTSSPNCFSFASLSNFLACASSANLLASSSLANFWLLLLQPTFWILLLFYFGVHPSVPCTHVLFCSSRHLVFSDNVSHLGAFFVQAALLSWISLALW